MFISAPKGYACSGQGLSFPTGFFEILLCACVLIKVKHFKRTNRELICVPFLNKSSLFIYFFYLLTEPAMWFLFFEAKPATKSYICLAPYAFIEIKSSNIYKFVFLDRRKIFPCYPIKKKKIRKFVIILYMYNSFWPLNVAKITFVYRGKLLKLTGLAYLQI